VRVVLLTRWRDGRVGYADSDVSDTTKQNRKRPLQAIVVDLKLERKDSSFIKFLADCQMTGGCLMCVWYATCTTTMATAYYYMVEQHKIVMASKPPPSTHTDRQQST
jgi:hypothetical protein